MLHLLTALALASAPPPDEAPHTTRWRLHAEWRTTFGAALDAPLTLGFAAAGARLQLSPALSLDLLALAVLPLSGEAHAGLGGELGLRVSPLHGPVRPFLRASMGLALFGRERPFLPGADVYEGVLTWAVGLELDLGAPPRSPSTPTTSTSAMARGSAPTTPPSTASAPRSA